MKVLKKKFKNLKIKKKIPGGDKLKHPINKTVLIKIPIKKKLGRWCEYYDGRLPYPIECSGNKQSPVCSIFKGKTETLIYNRSNCINCKRNVEWVSWKKGAWEKVKEAIANGEDLTNIEHGFNIIERD